MVVNITITIVRINLNILGKNDSGYKSNYGYENDSKSLYSNNYNYNSYNNNNYNNYKEGLKRNSDKGCSTNLIKSHSGFSQSIQSQAYNTKNNKRYSSQILLTHYEGVCNFLIFIKSCTPYVHKNDTHLIDEIKVPNFFKNFEKVSAFGMDINLIYESII
jgi:hypothetical protein